MPSTLVPKVTLTESVGSASVPGLNQTVIGIIGTSSAGTANTVYTLTSVSQADAVFGSNYSRGAKLVPMIKRAFAEGASKVVAISIGTPTVAAGTATLSANATAGANSITVTAGFTGITAGDELYIGTGQTYDNEEKLVVQGTTATTITFTSNLLFNHYIGETATEITAKAASAYQSAITLMEENEDKSIIVCEDNSDTVAGYIATAVENSYNNYNTPCIYIRGALDSDTASTAITKAQAMNNDRAIMVYPRLVDFNGATVSGGETAAAVAGLLAGNGIPKLNHNFSEFSSFGGVSSKITDFDALISGGVTPLALKYNSLHLVRLVTTQTTVNSIPDTTWREASVRLNVDYIEKVIARALQAKFLQKGNTPQTRLAIKTECTSILDTFASNQIILADDVTGTPAYAEPVVTTDALDDTKVNVELAVSPGKPLNFISLSFKVIL